MKSKTGFAVLAILLVCFLSVISMRSAIALSADINGDGFVNVRDAILLGKAFGSVPGDPNWNPAADLDENGVVNGIDATTLGASFGPVPPL